MNISFCVFSRKKIDLKSASKILEQNVNNEKKRKCVLKTKPLEWVYAVRSLVPKQIINQMMKIVLDGWKMKKENENTIDDGRNISDQANDFPQNMSTHQIMGTNATKEFC